MYLICEKCGFESNYEDEVCYYDINGYAVVGEEVEVSNPDAIAYVFCNDCAEEYLRRVV